MQVLKMMGRKERRSSVKEILNMMVRKKRRKIRRGVEKVL